MNIAFGILIVLIGAICLIWAVVKIEVDKRFNILSDLLFIIGFISIFVGVFVFPEVGRSQPVSSISLTGGVTYQIVCTDSKNPNLVVLTEVNAGKTKIYQFSAPVHLPDGAFVIKGIEGKEGNKIILVPLER